MQLYVDFTIIVHVIGETFIFDENTRLILSFVESCR